MKISELILKLEELKADHDDLDVCYIDHSRACSRDVTEVVATYPQEVVATYPHELLSLYPNEPQPACHITLK
jgi:hypothetical protein